MKMKTKHQNLQDAAKAVYRGNFIALNTCQKRKYKESNLSFQFRKLEKEEEKIKSSVNRRKEIIRIKTEINEIEKGKQQRKSTKSQVGLFAKVNKMNISSLAN